MSLFDFLFPKNCLGCGRKGVYFCSSCIKEINPLHPQVSLGKDPLDGLISIFSYESIIRKAISKLKYHFVFDFADELVDLALRLIELKQFDYSNCPTLTPIPLYWYRKNWRGFNQAEILGRKVAEGLKIDFCPNLLLRTRPTKPQVKLKGKDAEEKRRENVKGAFRINPQYKNLNSEYLLFDDVWTTGATMKECARVLKKAGVKRVFGLTLAR